MLGDTDEAQDVAQAALVRAWRSFASCASPEAPHAWTRRIAQREALRAGAVARRRDGPLADLEAAAGVVLTGPDADTALERLDVKRALDDLSEPDRRLLALRYDQNLTQPEVAEVLGVPEGTVKIRLHRIRKRLRTVLATAYGPDHQHR